MNEPIVVDTIGERLLSIEKARAHVNVMPYPADADHSEPWHPDDTEILDALDAATLYAERFMGRTLVAKRYKLVIDCLGPHSALIRLPMAAPLQEVESITYLDAEGNEQTLPDTVYKGLMHLLPGRVTLRHAQSWPTTYDEPGAVSIVYIAGYDENKVPADVLRAVKAIMAEFFENREDTVPYAQRTVAFSAENILRAKRLYDEGAA